MTTEETASRDILRVTTPTLEVLRVLLVDRGAELHGWAIMKSTGRSGPTVYKILDRLEDCGMITARWESEHPDGNKPRRRFYRLTPDGEERAQAMLAGPRPASSYRKN